MTPTDLMTAVRADSIRHLWIVYHDYNGRACAKTVPASKFADAIERGIVFARANLDFALNDHMAEGAIFQAQTGDFLAVPDPASYRPLPHLPGVGIVHAFMLNEDGTPFDGCPRAALRRMVERYAERDMRITLALEAEFALYRKTETGDYEPASADGMFTVAGLDRHAPLMLEIVETLETMGIRVEQLGKEYGPSQFEFTVRYSDPLTAADDYLITKLVVKALASRRGLIASYMPKAFDHLPGCGLHVHVGVWRGETNLLAGTGEDAPLSPLGLHMVGGLLAHAPGLNGVGAPTVNSYKRLLPGSWAPAHIAWGVGNRGALVRVPDSHQRARIEYRAGDCTCNPYIYLTALLAAGLDGIDRQLDPGENMHADDVGHMDADALAARGIGFLPRDLGTALSAFESDPALTAPLMPVIAPEFVKVKRLELAAYNLAVHPWERALYLEIT
jgi:glutamine synthetase